MRTDEELIALAQNYLRQVGRLQMLYPSPEHVLQHCVDVYNERKEQGLEL